MENPISNQPLDDITGAQKPQPVALAPEKEEVDSDEQIGKQARKGLLWFLAIVLLIVLLFGAFATWMVRRTWPTHDGNLAAAGLIAPVTIERDEWGIPHIYAENEHDLFYAQGYVHAQDRLWQMDFNRRTAKGQLAEAIGPSLLGTDKFHLNMRFVPAAEKSWEMMSEEDKSYLQAYSDGVNAYMEANMDNLPLEFTVMGFKPEPWTPIDTLAWGNLLSMHLSSNRRIELVRAQIIDQAGEDVMQFLLPSSADDSPIIVPSEAGAYEDFVNVNEAALSYLSDMWGMPSAGVGSNGWVVSGDHTETGMPIIANDIHIFPSQPSIWYSLSLHGGDFDVVGFSLSGVPGVISGHNQDIAWGMTNFAPDTQDYYIEKLDDLENPTQYEYMGEWHDLNVIEETINIKGEDPETITIYETIHGPIMNETLPSEDDEEDEEKEPLALRWTLQDGNHLFGSIMALNRASNWDEFRDALEMWELPGQNALYADMEGNIGYQATGKIPIRQEGHSGSVPVPGWTDEYEWVSYIPFDELPSSYNPPNGVLVSANSKIADDDYPYYLTDSYVPGYRARRIAQLLDELAPISVEDMETIQADTFAPTAEQLIPYLSAVEPENDIQREALRQVQEWDMYHETDRLGAAVYDAWHITLLRNIVTDELGEDIAGEYVAGRYIRHATQHAPMLIDLMKDPNNPWFDDIDTPEVETRDDIVRRSFTDAVDWLGGQYGPNPSNWAWGDVHVATFPHQPFSWLNNPVADVIFNSKGYPARGSNFSVHTNSYAWENPFDAWIISNARHVTDLEDMTNSVIMESSGQTSQLFHPHREDLNAMWAAAESHPMIYTSEMLEPHMQDTLVLTPQ